MLDFSQSLVAAATAKAALLSARLRKRRSLASCVLRSRPEWQPGQPQPAPYDSDATVDLDPAKVAPSQLYTLMISAVVPRPIAFISTVSNEGHRNLSPFSFFNVMGYEPPIVCIGVGRSPTREGGKKDTLINIEETG